MTNVGGKGEEFSLSSGGTGVLFGRRKFLRAIGRQRRRRRRQRQREEKKTPAAL
jgi:hypothetical protein